MAQAAFWSLVIGFLAFGHEVGSFVATALVFTASAATSMSALAIVLRVPRSSVECETLVRGVGVIVLSGVALAQCDIRWSIWCGLVATLGLGVPAGRRHRTASAVLVEEIDQLTILGIAWLAFAVRDRGAAAWLLPAPRLLEVFVRVGFGMPAHVSSSPGPGLVGSRAWRTCAIAFGFASLAPCGSDAWAFSFALAGVIVRAWACVVAWPGRGGGGVLT